MLLVMIKMPMDSVFLALLFTAGLLLTLFTIQTKKRFMAWLQSLFITKESTTTATRQTLISNPTAADHKKKVAAIKRTTGTTTTTTRDKAELKSVFATFDKNGDGFITRQELGDSLMNIGIHMAEGEVADMVEKVDSNGDGLIDLDEFCELFDSVVGREEEEVVVGREADLKEAFDVFDGDGDGLITVEELGLVLSSMGLKEGKRMENCKEMIRNVDMDGDGMVNFDEFKKMMESGGRLVAAVS